MKTYMMVMMVTGLMTLMVQQLLLMLTRIAMIMKMTMIMPTTTMNLSGKVEVARNMSLVQLVNPRQSLPILPQAATTISIFCVLSP